MPSEHTCFDPGHIEQLLAGRLTTDEQAQFEDHLKACATCRDWLQTTAAEQEYWKEAAIHLKDDPLDEEMGLADPGGAASGERANPLRITDYFDPTNDPRMLGRFGGYEIVGIIGCGGMGVVLKGYEASLDRYVAIKVLAPHSGGWRGSAS